MANHSLSGHWQQRVKPRLLQPSVWRWEEIYACLTEAGEVIRLGADTGRRTVQLMNPSLQAEKATSRTLQMSVQLVRPGEAAACHRHTAQAIRFVVQGHGAYTTVEGVQMMMSPGDLILTPGWTWHDHANPSDEPIIWLDGLDVRLATYLDAQFQVNYSNPAQDIRVDSLTANTLLGPTRPPDPPSFPFPPFHYRWTDTESVLKAHANAAGDPFDAILLEYQNPVSGGHTLPTLSCRIQMIRPGERTKSHRHTGVTVYHTVSGRGAVTIDGTRHTIGPRDCFFIPSWQYHHFENSEGSEPFILFSMSDRPVLDALGLYFEEEEGKPSAYSNTTTVNA